MKLWLGGTNTLSLEAPNVSILNDTDAEPSQKLDITKGMNGEVSTSDAVNIGLVDSGVGGDSDALQISRTGSGTGYALNVSSGNSYFHDIVGIGTTDVVAQLNVFTATTVDRTIKSVNQNSGAGGTYYSGNFVANGDDAGITAKYGLDIQATGAAGINYGVVISATGGTNNYGLIVNDGYSGFNINPPQYILHTHNDEANGRAISAGSNVAVAGTNYAGYFEAGGASTTNYGIYADASDAGTNWAGFFNAGNVAVKNNLVVGGEVIHAGYELSVEGDTYLNGNVKGTSSWSGQEAQGAWGAATKNVVLLGIGANDLVFVTPISDPVGTEYWVTVTGGIGFTVNSDNAGETMGFNWIVIKQ